MIHPFFVDYFNSLKHLTDYVDHKAYCDVVTSRLEEKNVRTGCSCGLDGILRDLGLDIGPGRRK